MKRSRNAILLFLAVFAVAMLAAGAIGGQDSATAKPMGGNPSDCADYACFEPAAEDVEAGLDDDAVPDCSDYSDGRVASPDQTVTTLVKVRRASAHGERSESVPLRLLTGQELDTCEIDLLAPPSLTLATDETDGWRAATPQTLALETYHAEMFGDSDLKRTVVAPNRVNAFLSKVSRSMSRLGLSRPAAWPVPLALDPAWEHEFDFGLVRAPRRARLRGLLTWLSRQTVAVEVAIDLLADQVRPPRWPLSAPRIAPPRAVLSWRQLDLPRRLAVWAKGVWSDYRQAGVGLLEVAGNRLNSLVPTSTVRRPNDSPVRTRTSCRTPWRLDL